MLDRQTGCCRLPYLDEMWKHVGYLCKGEKRCFDEIAADMGID